MARKAIGLNLKLTAQPSGGTNEAEWQVIERAWSKRCAILLQFQSNRRIAQSSDWTHWQGAGEAGEAGLLKESAAGDAG
jgi:hypothetical protein